MEKRERQEGITTGQAKGQTLRWQPLQPNLARVNEAARRSGQTRFTALLHHVDVAGLERAFRRQRRAASPGIDGVMVEDYGRALEDNLRRLHARIHSGRYWPKPVRRTYIPKADGSQRPLGIPTLEDKIVQGAMAEVLNAVYEADFVGFNYRSLRLFKECVVRLWRKMLGRRSQKGRMTWAAYRQLLTVFPLPEPMIHRAWQG